MKQLYTFLFGLLFTTTAFGQGVDVAIELHYADDGTVPGYPAGYNTWRIYVEMENSGDFLSAVYATMDGPALSIATSTNHIWNSEYGAVLGGDLSAVAFSTFPEAEYDSYVTIGMADNSSAGWLSSACMLPSLDAIEQAFGVQGGAQELDANLTIEDGLWHTLLGSENGFTQGPDNRVLIAQVTTDGDISVCANFQIFPGGVNGELTEYDNYCETASATSISEQDAFAAELFPNPTTGMVQLQLNQPERVDRAEVVSITGQVVDVLNVNSTATTFHLAHATAGVYLVRLISEDGTLLSTRRLVRQ